MVWGFILFNTFLYLNFLFGPSLTSITWLVSWHLSWNTSPFFIDQSVAFHLINNRRTPRSCSISEPHLEEDSSEVLCCCLWHEILSKDISWRYSWGIHGPSLRSSNKPWLLLRDFVCLRPLMSDQDTVSLALLREMGSMGNNVYAFWWKHRD